jgi:hypothetical protein
VRGAEDARVLQARGRDAELAFDDHRRSWAMGARVRAETGRREEARRVLEELAVDRFVAIQRDMNWLPALSLLAEAASALGDEAHACILHDLLRPHRAEHIVIGGGTLHRGPVLLCLGILAAALGRLDDAAAHFSDAVAVCARLGARAWGARAEVRLAHVLRLEEARATRRRPSSISAPAASSPPPWG